MQRVITVLKESFLKQKPVDNYLKVYFKENHNFGARDRAFINDTVWGIIRNYKKLKLSVGDDIEKIVDEYNKNPVFDASVLEYPDFLISKIDKEDLLYMQARTESHIDICVNSLKTKVPKILKDLKAYNPEKLPHVRNGIRIKQRIDLNTIKSFKQGMFMVQDEGSQMVSEAVQIKGQSVLDYCAGAGGKSLHLAMRMQNKGEIIAYDIVPAKLDELRKRADKMGFSIIFPRYPFDNEEFDNVLADVPCSGSGTYARTPDAKWRFDEEKLNRLLKNGAEILNNVKKYVRKGGVLTYATCSLIDAENMGQIESFLSLNHDYSLINAMTIRPSIYHTDGFFVANLQRN